MLRQRSWSPWAVGAALGVLSWISLWSSDHLLGITTAFEYSAALLLKTMTPAYYASTDYAHALAAKGDTPMIDWEWMLVLGVFLGAFVSSKLSGDRKHPDVPKLWAWRFGDGQKARYIAAFFGAGFMLLGARIAHGCTSGHGISGALQLAVSSWIFTVVIFVTGVIVTFMMFGKEGAEHVRGA